MTQFERELSAVFFRYDYDETGFIFEKDDMRMLAVNLGFKLGIKDTPNMDDVMHTLPPMTGPAGWDKEAFKVWYMESFGIGTRRPGTADLISSPMLSPPPIAKSPSPAASGA